MVPRHYLRGRPVGAQYECPGLCCRNEVQTCSPMSVKPTGAISSKGHRTREQGWHRPVPGATSCAPDSRGNLLMGNNVNGRLASRTIRRCIVSLYKETPQRREATRPVGNTATRPSPAPQAGRAAIDRSLTSRWKAYSPPSSSDGRRVNTLLKQNGDMAIVPCEQYFDFARELAGRIHRVMLQQCGWPAARPSRWMARTKRHLAV
jgi:hypothetical protein